MNEETWRIAEQYLAIAQQASCLHDKLQAFAGLFAGRFPTRAERRQIERIKAKGNDLARKMARLNDEVDGKYGEAEGV